VHKERDNLLKSRASGA